MSLPIQTLDDEYEGIDMNQYRHEKMVSSEDEDNDGSDIQIRNNYTNKNQSSPIQTDPLITQLMDLIKSSGCNIVDFTKYYNIISSDIDKIKEAVNNFDEWLINYRNSKQSGVNNEKETEI